MILTTWWKPCQASHTKPGSYSHNTNFTITNIQVKPERLKPLHGEWDNGRQQPEQLPKLHVTQEGALQVFKNATQNQASY